MRPSLRHGPVIFVVLGALIVTACVSTATPIVGSGQPPQSTASPASAAPSPSAIAAASATPLPIPSVEPTDTPDTTEQPTLRPTPAPIAGCGTGQAGFTAHRDEVPKTLQFGGATIEYTTAGLEMRDESIVTGDSIPGGIGLSRNEIAVVVGPGDHIILRGKDIALTDTSGSAVPWASVTFSGGLANLAGSRIGLEWRVRADGSLSVSAPSTFGDWAVELLPRWQGACLKGDGTAYARIKVR